MVTHSTPSSTLRDNYYIYGPTLTPIEQINISASNPSYLLSDALGSVRLITSPTGSVVSSMTYDAWGNPEASTGSVASPFGYAGYYVDAGSGLYDLRARWYDAVTGQFLSVDPAVMTTESPFAYAADDPVDNMDPTGFVPSGKPAACTVFFYAVPCVATSTAYANGYEAQDSIRAMTHLNGKTFKVTVGNVATTRVEDLYNPLTGEAFEIKTGRQALSSFVGFQIAKDVALLGTNGNPGSVLTSVQWQFWPSTSSGTRPSLRLVYALLQANLPVRIFYYNSTAPTADELINPRPDLAGPPPSEGKGVGDDLYNLAREILEGGAV